MAVVVGRDSGKGASWSISRDGKNLSLVFLHCFERRWQRLDDVKEVADVGSRMKGWQIMGVGTLEVWWSVCGICSHRRNEEKKRTRKEKRKEKGKRKEVEEREEKRVKLIIKNKRKLKQMKKSKEREKGIIKLNYKKEISF